MESNFCVYRSAFSFDLLPSPLPLHPPPALLFQLGRNVLVFSVVLIAYQRFFGSLHLFLTLQQQSNSLAKIKFPIFEYRKWAKHHSKYCNGVSNFNYYYRDQSEALQPAWTAERIGFIQSIIARDGLTFVTPHNFLPHTAIRQRLYLINQTSNKSCFFSEKVEKCFNFFLDIWEKEVLAKFWQFSCKRIWCFGGHYRTVHAILINYKSRL